MSVCEKKERRKELKKGKRERERESKDPFDTILSSILFRGRNVV